MVPKFHGSLTASTTRVSPVVKSGFGAGILKVAKEVLAVFKQLIF
jgi:hypothetical protein